MVGELGRPEPHGERRRDFWTWDHEMGLFTQEELRGLGRSALDPIGPAETIAPASDEVLRAQHEDDVRQASELPDLPPDFQL